MKSLLLLIFFILQVKNHACASGNVEQLKQKCQDESSRNYSDELKHRGQSFRGVYILIEDDQKKQYMFDCSYFRIGPLTEAAYDKMCKDQEIPKENISSLINQVGDIQEKIQCDKDKTDLSSKQCLKEVGCNMARSALTIATKLSISTNSSSIKSEKSCLDGTQSDCLTEFIAGIVKNVWGNVKAIGYLAEVAYKKTLSFFSSEDTAKVEKKTSESLHAAAGAEDSFIDKFKANPAQAIKEFGEGIYKTLSKMIADNFACAQWSGVPHVSKCLKPLNDWDCSSCDQKFNAVCGVAGVLGGEAVTSYLTGVAVKGIVTGAKAAQISRIIQGVKPVGPKAAAALNVGAKVGAGALKAALYLPMKVISALYKVPGLGSYLKLMDKAFMLGYQGPKAYWAARLQKQASDESAALRVKQAETDLKVAKEDLKLATLTVDSETAKQLQEKIKRLEKDVGKDALKPVMKPQQNSEKKTESGKVPSENRKHYTPEQKLEILADPDYKTLISKFPGAEDQDKVIEILSILKNHNKVQLTKPQILEEFDKLTKQCY